jgi:hypothetical protein
MKERRETRLRDDVCAVPQHASHHRRQREGGGEEGAAAALTLQLMRAFELMLMRRDAITACLMVELTAARRVPAVPALPFLQLRTHPPSLTLRLHRRGSRCPTGEQQAAS